MMPVVRVFVIDRDGSHRSVDADSGQVLMEVLRDAGFDIPGTCGGVASCGTCHVHVMAHWMASLGPRTADERELVSSLENYQSDASRLACQIRLSDQLDGLHLRLASAD